MNISEISFSPIMESLTLCKLEDSVYFSEQYSDYISNSRLGWINPSQNDNPDVFFGKMPPLYSEATLLGSAVHELILQPDYFELDNSINRPTAKLGFMCDWLYNVWKKNKSVSESDVIKASDEINYYKGKMSADKIKLVLDTGKPYWQQLDALRKTDKEPIVLDAKNRKRVKDCVQSINNDKNIMSLLNPSGMLEEPISENEYAILLDIMVKYKGENLCILKFKSKLDHFCIDKELNTICVNDLKTIGKSVSEFEGNWDRFHYYREIAVYSWLLSLVANKFYNVKDAGVLANCLVVSTIPSYETRVYKVASKEIVRGWKEFTFLLKLIVSKFEDFKEASVFHSI